MTPDYKQKIAERTLLRADRREGETIYDQAYRLLMERDAVRGSAGLLADSSLALVNEAVSLTRTAADLPDQDPADAA